jgi:hypothetical protein
LEVFQDFIKGQVRYLSVSLFSGKVIIVWNSINRTWLSTNYPPEEC